MENKITLIKRSTPMCSQCNTMQSILEEEGIAFNTIDIAKDADAVEKYSIMSVPVILINDGDTQVRLNGIQPIEVIKELLED